MKLTGKMFSSGFIKHVSVVLSGTVAAQIITLGFSPFLTRLYSPEAFGVFGIFMMLVGIISTFASGRYEIAVMLPKKSEDSITALALSLLLSIGTSLVLIPCILLESYIKIPFFDEVRDFLWVLPVYVIFNSFYFAMDYWVSRNSWFKVISVALILGTLIGNSLKLVYGYFQPTAFMLIIGSLLIPVFQVVIYLSKRKELFSQLRLYTGFGRITSIAKEYSFLPFFRAPKDLLNSVTSNAPLMFLGLFFTPASVGFYVLADRILKIPSLTLGNAIRKVFFQRSSQNNQQGHSLFRTSLLATIAMWVLGIPVFGTITAFGPGLFEVVFGNGWYQAGVYARWLSILFWFSFINIPSVVLISVLRKERFFLVYEVASIILRVLGLVLGTLYFSSDTMAVALFSLIGAVCNVFLICKVLLFTKGLKEQKLRV